MGKERGRPRRQCKGDIEDTFNGPITEAGRLASYREHFQSVVRDVMSSRISS